MNNGLALLGQSRIAKGLEGAGPSKQHLLNTASVAQWLSVSPRTICLWAECREIPAIKIGRQWRFREEDLRRWLEESIPGNTGFDVIRK